MKSLRVVAVLSLVICAVGTCAQSFNIELDINGGGSEAGQGVPSSFFGAAAGQLGSWSRVSASRGGATPIHDLVGQLTNVTFDPSAHGGGAGSGMGNNTGEYRLLLNDGTVVTIPCAFTISGLTAGRYLIYSYVLSRASESLAPARVTISNATNPVQFSGLGYRPSNQFALGITHSLHDVWLAGSALTINVENMGANSTTATGFQIVKMPVPEPTALSAFVLAGAFLRFRRR